MPGRIGVVGIASNDGVALVGRTPSRWRVHALTATTALALAFGLAAAIDGGSLDQRARTGQFAPASVAPSQRLSGHGLSSLPLAAQGPVSAALAADSASYRIISQPGGLRAMSPAQRLMSTFSRSGVSVRAGSSRLSLQLSAIGYGSARTLIAPVAPRARANRVSFARAGVREWYANGPLGLEQGFTVTRAPGAPAAHVGGPLTLAINMSGNTTASLAEGGRGIALRRDGNIVLRYSGLAATDSRGRALHSWLALEASRLLVRVDARGARFPITIDPFVQQGKALTGAGETAEGEFGYSIALSADGKTALIGAPYDNKETGAAFVFVQERATREVEGEFEVIEGVVWEQQGPKLVGEPESQFGTSVALSADGNTALIGEPSRFGENGFAPIFTRSKSKWTQTSYVVRPEFGEGGNTEALSRFGESVALSADGKTALVGSPEDQIEKHEVGVGAAWAFTCSLPSPAECKSSSWTPREELTGGEEETGPSCKTHSECGVFGQFGSSVALSADGNTAFVGAPFDDERAGSAYAFTRSGGAWTQQGAKLKGGEEVGAGQFGGSVALSGAGNTALVGGYADSHGAGAAWVLARAGESWAQQGPKLTGAGESGEGSFGHAVALSGDGNTALIGGPGDSARAGAAWLFTRAGSVWSGEGSKLTGDGGEFGSGVALASHVPTALVGARRAGPFGGDARVFVKAVPPTAETDGLIFLGQLHQTSLTLYGSVNPNGAETLCTFEYGTSEAYGASTPCTAPVGSGERRLGVEATAGGLSPHTTYHFRVVAGNVAGSSAGKDSTLTTLPYPPATVTGAASSITATSAALNASVNPNGGEVSACKFEYGTSASYGASVPCSSPPGSGESPVAVSAPLTGLSASATYHFRVVATNTGGTSDGADQRFSTAALPTVTRMKPASGPASGGTMVTISGTELTAASTVDFGSTPATGVAVVSSKSLTAIAPAHVGPRST